MYHFVGRFLETNDAVKTHYIVDIDPEQVTLRNDTKTLHGVRIREPEYWSLCTPTGSLDGNDITAYYRVADGCCGQRFIVFDDGHCALTAFGSGLPVLGTLSGVLITRDA